MMSSSPRGTAFVWVSALATALLAAVALQGAMRWYDHPIGGMLVSADLDVSSVGMPTWSGVAQGLTYPDRVIAVDGIDLTAYRGSAMAKRWDQAILDAVQRGSQEVHARVRTSAGDREVHLRIDRLSPAIWWLCCGGLVFNAALYVVAALTALTASPRGKLARAFAKFALLAAAFLFTFFDFQTSQTLMPIYCFAWGWVPLSLVALALRLPDDASFVRHFPSVFVLLDAVGIGVGSVMAVRAFAGVSTHSMRATWTIVFGASVLVSVAVFAGRFALATGRRRSILRLVIQATAFPYTIVAIGVLGTLSSPRAANFAFLWFPALALAPVATFVAFARNDVWGSRALLSRVATRTVAGGIACAVSAGLGGVFATSLGVPFREALFAAAAGAAAAGPLIHLALRTVDRSFFPAVTEYKPTIEQLSEDLTVISAPDQISSAVERTVRRWLPCDRVEFVAEHEGERTSPVPELSGEIWIRAKFGGRALGILRVGEKRGGALFTSEDLDLLQTIANQAALALAYARSYVELEQRRRQQAAAWQVERLALVETLAAEVAHEVRYPINFFRSVFQRTPAGTILEPDEIEVGCEEVDRLERLVSGLKRLVGYHVDRQLVGLIELANHAEILLRDALRNRTIRVDVPGGVSLRCDSDQVRQVLVNLVANALDASGPHGQVGIGWKRTDSGAELCVWDDGPGFAGDASELFAAWFTTKPHGTGLGLAITQRIVRAHNWRIDAERSAKTTRFVISIPRADIVEEMAEEGLARRIAS